MQLLRSSANFSLERKHAREDLSKVYSCLDVEQSAEGLQRAEVAEVRTDQYPQRNAALAAVCICFPRKGW